MLSDASLPTASARFRNAQQVGHRLQKQWTPKNFAESTGIADSESTEELKKGVCSLKREEIRQLLLKGADAGPALQTAARGNDYELLSLLLYPTFLVKRKLDDTPGMRLDKKPLPPRALYRDVKSQSVFQAGLRLKEGRISMANMVLLVSRGYGTREELFESQKQRAMMSAILEGVTPVDGTFPCHDISMGEEGEGREIRWENTTGDGEVLKVDNFLYVPARDPLCLAARLPALTRLSQERHEAN